MAKVAVLAVVLVVFGVGCPCPQQRAALTGVDACWKVVGPRYVEYVNKDPFLNKPGDREDRIRTAQMIDKLIAEGLKE